MDDTQRSSHGTIALALMISLLRELHHERLLDEDRFRRMLLTSRGVLRILSGVERTYEDPVNAEDDLMDYGALFRDLNRVDAWAEERNLEHLLEQLEATFLNLTERSSA